jgi:hypothetical protein
MRKALRSGATGPRAVALALLACALALRFLVPAGWMPVSDAYGLHLAPCSGTGPMTPATMPAMAMHHVMAGMDHHAPGGQDQPAPDHACPFAGLGLALAEPALPAVALPPAVEATLLPARILVVAIGRGLAAPPPPATGPPVLG